MAAFLQQLHTYWESSPATVEAWPDEWAASNLQVEEQAQLLWALSDRAAPRYRKPPPEPPEQPTPAKVPSKARTKKEVRFTLSPNENNNPQAQRQRLSLWQPCHGRTQWATRREDLGEGFLTSTYLRQGQELHPKNVQCNKADAYGLTQSPARAIACQSFQTPLPFML